MITSLLNAIYTTKAIGHFMPILLHVKCTGGQVVDAGISKRRCRSRALAIARNSSLSLRASRTRNIIWAIMAQRFSFVRSLGCCLDWAGSNPRHGGLLRRSSLMTSPDKKIKKEKTLTRLQCTSYQPKCIAKIRFSSSTPSRWVKQVLISRRPKTCNQTLTRNEDRKHCCREGHKQVK